MKKRPLTKYSHGNTVKNNKLNICPAVAGLPKEKGKKQNWRGL
jgi:hypothetical protein